MRGQTQIDEMPVETHDFDDLVVHFAARKSASAFHGRNMPRQTLRARDNGGGDHAERNVRCRKIGDHEKAGSELGRSPWGFQRPNAFMDRLVHSNTSIPTNIAHKGHNQQQQHNGFEAIAAVTEIDRHCHPVPLLLIKTNVMIAVRDPLARSEWPAIVSAKTSLGFERRTVVDMHAVMWESLKQPKMRVFRGRGGS